MDVCECDEGVSYCDVGVCGGMMLLFRVSGLKSSSMLSMLSMFSEPIVPLQIHEILRRSG